MTAHVTLPIILLATRSSWALRADAREPRLGLGPKVKLPFRPKGIAKPIDLWTMPELAKAAP
jgi:hypothetical protein